MRCYDLVQYHLNKVEFLKTAKWHRHSATLLLYKNITRIQPVGNKFHFHTYRVSTKAEQPVPASSEPFCELTNFETLSFTPVHPVFWVFQAPCPGPWQLQSEESVQPLTPEALVAAAQPHYTESSVGIVLPNKNSGQNRILSFQTCFIHATGCLTISGLLWRSTFTTSIEPHSITSLLPFPLIIRHLPEEFCLLLPRHLRDRISFGKLSQAIWGATSLLLATCLSRGDLPPLLALSPASSLQTSS